jgi:glycosyltransferase involved in cell wall biosynthesis
VENSIDISLLLPTRGRPQLLQRLLESLVETTSRIERLEVVLFIDADDQSTGAVSHPLLELTKLIEPPGKKMGQMNQACYENSRGRFVMLMNDDVIFRTKSWDTRVLDAFARFPDEVALVYGNDLHQRKSMATLPIVSRAVCEALGGICPRDYLNVYIDVHLYDIFKKLARLGYQRVVYLEDVIFEHMHPEAGKSPMDATYVKKNERFDDFLFINLEDERRDQAKRLKHYIERTQRNRLPHGERGRVKSLFKRMLACAFNQNS